MKIVYGLWILACMIVAGSVHAQAWPAKPVAAMWSMIPLTRIAMRHCRR